MNKYVQAKEVIQKYMGRKDLTEFEKLLCSVYEFAKDQQTFVDVMSVALNRD